MAIFTRLCRTLITFSLLRLISAVPGVLQPTFVTPRALPANTQLKVLCVGDSITVGIGDGHPMLEGLNNGYRLDLYNMLTAAGLDTQFVGSQISGTNNPQPRMEGYGFQVIDTILGKIQGDSIMSEHPNLVLIHAGTNDNDLPSTSAGAPTRLGNLLDFVLCQNPNAVVLVAKLVQNKFNQSQTNTFNAQVPNIVDQRYMKGYKVRVVDMSMIGGNELSDALHPTATGYVDMANRWFSAISGVPDSWWSASSSSSSQPASGASLETCARGQVSFSPAIDGDLVALGFHVANDPPAPLSTPESKGNTFSPGWGDDGIVAIGTSLSGSGVLFADIDGDGRPDYIWANSTADSTADSAASGSIRAWLNKGQDKWAAVNNGDEIAFGRPKTSYVELADLTGDKKAEYVLVADGLFKIWLNGGPNGQIWDWSELDLAAKQLNDMFGGTVPFHFFADMTGDGRADLIVYNSNGVLDIYLNQGMTSDGGFGWTPCKNIGIATGTLSFVDIDGDGRADYVSMDTDGGLSGWLNKYGGSCDITWVPINGRTPKSLALGTGSPPSQVRLADLTADGKADYLVIDGDSGAVHLYPNTGSNHPPDSTGIGGYGAAVRLADMDGDGRADYVSVTNYSGIAVSLNKGQGKGDQWIWDLQDNGIVIALGYSGATRHEVRLADMNGDGIDDYLIVDDATGALHCYLNLGPTSTTGPWKWNIMGEIAIGIGGVGAGVRIADFDGDGRADYIYLDESGVATVWLNAGAGDNLEKWQAVNGGAVAALGVGAARGDVLFADIDGDGKADYCKIDPDTGAVDVWYNLYDGKGVGWAAGGTVISGQGYPGQNVRFARMGTSGRYDYVAVEESDGAIKVWINDCSDVISTKSRTASGICAAPPLPPRASPEPAPARPPFEVSTNAGGQTVLQQGTNGVQVTLALGITTPQTLTETDGEVFTYIPGGNSEDTTFTNAAGQTVVQGSLGAQVTLSPGITTPVTTTGSDGEVLTFDSSPSNTAPITTIDSAGLTVLSQSGGAITLPTGVTTLVTSTAPDGIVFTFNPSPSDTPSIVTTTDSAGLTVVSESGEAITIPTGITTPITTTASDGAVFTLNSFAPFVITTTDSAGQTVLSESGEIITIPTGITTPFTTTASDGAVFTLNPPGTLPLTSSSSSSSTIPAGGLVWPVLTSVPTATSTGGATVIPCDLWFFSICIEWPVAKIKIPKWRIDIPPGIRPPGPPPRITFPPSLGIGIDIPKPLPDWPQISIGPDGIPTFTPQSEPEDCKTQTGEICLTSTSYGVSAETTTATQVLSTCATVYGCEATDSSTDTTTTGGCTSTSTSTNYYVSCSTTAPSASSCTTTSSSTTTGCSITASTVTCGVLSPTGIVPDPACSAALYQYIVYPKDGSNGGEVSDTNSKLKSYLDDQSDLHSLTNKDLGTIYWALPLTYNQSLEVASMSGVAGIEDDCGDYCTYDPNTSINYQDSFDESVGFDIPQLGYLSWPKTDPTNKWPYRYFFDSSAGRQVDVYILDTGALIQHPEFVGLQPKWIQLGKGDQAGENDVGNHGTAMLSLVAGLRLGVAKNARPIIVRTPGAGVSARSMNKKDWLDGLEAIYNALRFDDLGTTQAIVLLAQYFPREERGGFTFNGQSGATAVNGFEEYAHELLVKLVGRGAVLVTGSGNMNNGGFRCDGWPANFGKRNSDYYIPSLMVVGATDSEGQQLYGKYDYDNGIPHFYGPGVDTIVAEGDPRAAFKYRYSKGTSDSAALTAGLAAYFLKLIRLNDLTDNKGDRVVDSPQALKDFMSKDALWSRADVNAVIYNDDVIRPRPGLWNRVKLDPGYCPWNPNQAVNRFKRQQESVTGSCYIPDPTSSTLAQSTTLTTDIATLSSYVACTTQQPDPDNGIAEGYCVCSGSTFAQSTAVSATPANVCAYTSPLPLTTTSISTTGTLPLSTTSTSSISTAPSASTSSVPSPITSSLFEIFDSPPYTSDLSVSCGIFDAFTATAGISLSKATDLIDQFCSPPARSTRRVNPGNTIYAPYDLGNGNVFLVGAKYNNQTACVEDVDGPGVEITSGDGNPDQNCVDNFMTIINDCDTTTTTSKIGGSGASKCVIFFAIEVDNWDKSTIKSSDDEIDLCADDETDGGCEFIA